MLVQLVFACVYVRLDGVALHHRLALHWSSVAFVFYMISVVIWHCLLSGDSLISLHGWKKA